MRESLGVSARDVHEALLRMPDNETKNLYTGDCRGCGECCSRFLPLSTGDIALLTAYVKAHGVQQRPEADTDIDLRCPYLTEAQECAIYPARPAICRVFRCDLCESRDYEPIRRILHLGPYKTYDMREVAPHT